MPLVALLFSVTLTAPFGIAEAEATDVGLPLEVVITVEVAGAREAVLARIVGSGGELEPVAMASRHDGTWGATVRLSEREDVLVAFEALTSDGASVISEPHRLTDLGVDPAIFTIGEPTTTASRGWSPPEGAGWLAMAAIAAVLAVALLAMWTVDSEAPEHLLSADPERTGDPDNDSRPR